MRKLFCSIPILAGLDLLLASCGVSSAAGHDAEPVDFGASYPLPVPVENSLLAKFAAKPVLDSVLIDDMEGGRDWKVKEGPATIKYVSERSRDGKQSLRYSTIMRDEEHLSKSSNRTSWGSFGGEQGGGSKIGLTFDEPQDWTAYNRVSIWVYIHPGKTPIHHFFLDIVNDGTDYNTLTPRHDSVIQDLDGGEWHEVLWEIPDVPRDKVREFNIFQTLIGYEPGNDSIETMDFDRLQLQTVKAENVDGWAIEPGEMAYSHVGYMPDSRKEALASPSPAREFRLVDDRGNVVYRGEPVVAHSGIGDFAVLDFTEFRTPGNYRIEYDTVSSNLFPIGEDVWLKPAFAALNFYFCQRCGYEVPGIHGVCHRDWMGFHGDEMKPINGGWHDAGDLSQGYFRTAMGTYSILRYLQVTEGDEKLQKFAEKLKDEALWGARWLVNNHFGDGHHVTWARQRIYSDNEPGTIDDVVIESKSVPWENFLGAAVLTMAQSLLPDCDKDFKEEMRRIAEDNYMYACYGAPDRDKAQKDWTSASQLEAAWGAVASAWLHKATGDDTYRKNAEMFGQLLLDCQEVKMVGDTLPIAGYFYTSTDRKRIVQNNHSAFYESPMIALRVLCEAYPESEKWIDWYAAAAIHADFLQKNGSECSYPYSLVPNAVYRRSDIDAIGDSRRRGFSLRQFEDGTHLDEEHTLRVFPIWDGDLFHGATSCHLSNSWALAEASLLRGDKEGTVLAEEQLEWTFGRNPFGQSLMYGVGYNFAPLFAYCTRNLVGALPVGMDCMGGDAPHWNSSAYATCKEIWIEPVSRCLGLMVAHAAASRKKSADVTLRMEKRNRQGNTAEVEIIAEGKGKCPIEIQVWNGEVSGAPATIELVPGKISRIPLTVSIGNQEHPYVVVATIRNDDGTVIKSDITG